MTQIFLDSQSSITTNTVIKNHPKGINLMGGFQYHKTRTIHIVLKTPLSGNAPDRSL